MDSQPFVFRSEISQHYCCHSFRVVFSLMPAIFSRKCKNIQIKWNEKSNKNTHNPLRSECERAVSLPDVCVCVSPGQLFCMFRDRNHQGAKYISEPNGTSTFCLLCQCWFCAVFFCEHVDCLTCTAIASFIIVFVCFSRFFYLFRFGVSIRREQFLFYAWAVFVSACVSVWARAHFFTSTRKIEALRNISHSKWNRSDHWLVEPFSDN